MRQTSTTPREITAEEARRSADLRALPFTTTADLEPRTTMVGQECAWSWPAPSSITLGSTSWFVVRRNWLNAW
jgi:hypothetical protein